jgi:hypothetical protein
MIRLRDDRPPGCDAAGRWARLYAMRGLVALPSCADRKQPAMRSYREFLYGEPTPPEWCDRWWSPNVQVVCGRPGGVAVVDLDGQEAAGIWKSWYRDHAGPPTWTVRTGGGNWQVWFRLPADSVEFRRRLLWGKWDPETQGWAKHQAIELLGCGRLAMAPPSLHPATGKPYTWHPGRCPLTLPEPAPLPAWVLDLPEPRQPRRERPNYPVPAGWTLPASTGLAGMFARSVVLRALLPSQRVDLVRSWGLVLAGTEPNGRGFLPCHALGRTDAVASAGFHPEGGFYSEPGAGSGARAYTLSLFDLGAALGAYPSWQACCDDLGRRLRLAPI